MEKHDIQQYNVESLKWDGHANSSETMKPLLWHIDVEILVNE